MSMLKIREKPNQLKIASLNEIIEILIRINLYDLSHSSNKTNIKSAIVTPVQLLLRVVGCWGRSHKFWIVRIRYLSKTQPNISPKVIPILSWFIYTGNVERDILILKNIHIVHGHFSDYTHTQISIYLLCVYVEWKSFSLHIFFCKITHDRKTLLFFFHNSMFI